MIFNSTNYDDIHKYYHDTVVKFKEYGDRLFTIESVSPSTIFGTDEDGTSFELHYSDDNPYTITYVLPNKSVFQYKDQAYLLQRVPARQYRRGLCKDNTQIISVSTGNNTGFNISMLKAFVEKQKFFLLKEAFARKGKIRSWALNSRMAYTKSTNALSIDAVVIGHFNAEKKTIELQQKVFLPELTKLMEETNCIYKVEVV